MRACAVLPSNHSHRHHHHHRKTILYSTNANVDRENDEELDKFHGPCRAYDATDTVELERGAAPWVEEALLKDLSRGCLAPSVLELKVRTPPP